MGINEGTYLDMIEDLVEEFMTNIFVFMGNEVVNLQL